MSKSDILQALEKPPAPGDRPIVCVQGLGFVGAAMAVAVASARDKYGNPCYTVIGVDLESEAGLARINAINDGSFPFQTADNSLARELQLAHEEGNLVATTNVEVFQAADVCVVDLPLDVDVSDEKPSVDLAPIAAAVRVLGERVAPGCLIVLETTVPPGTCEHVVLPQLRETLSERGIAADDVHFAYSFERVMPGPNYLDSIRSFWRAYAGASEQAADACESFLSSICAIDRFPLTRLSSLRAAETAKVLENSYRAVNIAFIDEWSKYAEHIGVDLFEVIDAIRVRPTHSNIREPGFGVGGYCLTKDPLLAGISTRLFFNSRELDFAFSEQAVSINDAMPLHTLFLLEQHLDSLRDKKVLLCGVSYKDGVGDTRCSPSEILVRDLLQKEAIVVCNDPLVSNWQELSLPVLQELPAIDDFDAIVFATRHHQYRDINFASWFEGHVPRVVIDANDVLTAAQRKFIEELGVNAISIGRGKSS